VLIIAETKPAPPAHNGPKPAANDDAGSQLHRLNSIAMFLGFETDQPTSPERPIDGRSAHTFTARLGVKQGSGGRRPRRAVQALLDENLLTASRLKARISLLPAVRAGRATG
jgi:hypothetical protein